jgi:hypothetical protein
LEVSTGFAICMYVFHFLFKFSRPQTYGHSVREVIDGAVIICMVLYWILWRVDEESWVDTRVGDQVLRAILSFWRIMQYRASSPTIRYIDTDNADGSLRRSVLGEDQFQFIWTTRSANLISGLLPEIESIFERHTSEKRISLSDLQKVLAVEIHCTDSCELSIRKLQTKLEKSAFCKNIVNFHRMDLEEVVFSKVGEQVVERMNSAHLTGGDGPVLMTFCGSREVGHMLGQLVIRANLLADSMSLERLDRIIFREEYYGNEGRSSARQEDDGSVDTQDTLQRPLSEMLPLYVTL